MIKLNRIDLGAVAVEKINPDFSIDATCEFYSVMNKVEFTVKVTIFNWEIVSIEGLPTDCEISSLCEHEIAYRCYLAQLEDFRRHLDDVSWL